MANKRTSRIVLLAALLASLILLVPATAAARVVVGVGYGGYWGPYWGPSGYWGYPYGPYGYWGYPYGPYGYPYGYFGEVKIKSPDDNAQIYINGSLAGRAHDLKHFYLRPGSYDIEQRIGADVQTQRIYVLSDRTVKLAFGPPGTPNPVPLPPPPEAGPMPGPNMAPPPRGENGY